MEIIRKLDKKSSIYYYPYSVVNLESINNSVTLLSKIIFIITFKLYNYSSPLENSKRTEWGSQGVTVILNTVINPYQSSGILDRILLIWPQNDSTR